jgi:hypothetical protein
VRYTLLPNGRTTDLSLVEDTADGKLGDLARTLVATMRFKEARRPPQPYEGATFGLGYRRSN